MGRRAIYAPNHPRANNRGYVLYSRWLMEQHLGRLLEEWEEVHHLNEDPLDDRIDNYELLTTAEHARRHAFARRKLDYGLIEHLRGQGLGYKRIAKITGYSRTSIQSACKVLEAAVE